MSYLEHIFSTSRNTTQSSCTALLALSSNSLNVRAARGVPERDVFGHTVVEAGLLFGAEGRAGWGWDAFVEAVFADFLFCSLDCLHTKRHFKSLNEPVLKNGHWPLLFRFGAGVLWRL